MEALKWPVLGCALFAVLPFASWIRQNSHAVPKLFFAIGLGPFVLKLFDQPLYITFFPWLGWAGLVKGAEISVIDVIALAIYLSLPRARQPLPFRFPMLLYFAAVFLSIFRTDVPLTAAFYCWQVARMFLLYVVVARSSSMDERIPLALMTGMTVGLCIQATIETYQTMFLGMFRAGGTMGHENYVGMMSHFVIMPLFALLLAGQRGWQPILGPTAGIVSTLLTVSRAAIGLNAVGLVMTFAISALQQWTRKKALIAMLGVGLMALLIPIVMASIEKRFSGDLAENDIDMRAAYIRAASLMFHENPMGVGANNYVRAANIGGYNVRAGVPLNRNLAVNVHNMYWLVATETGYFGICSFILLILRPMIVAFICGWRNHIDRRGAALLGFGVSLFVVYVHSWFEFIMMTAGVQYAFAITAGLVSGLAIQLGYWRPARMPQRIPTATAPRGSS